MITIRQLLDYYNGELTFNQIMGLFGEGKILLTNSTVSSSDLAVICERYELKNIDLRHVEVQQNISSIIERSTGEINEDSFRELTGKVEELKRDLYSLDKRARRMQGKAGDRKDKQLSNLTRQEFSLLMDISESYERLFSHMESNTSYLVDAERYRQKADELYQNPPTRNEKRAKAENLFRLGELKVVLGFNDSASQRFGDAKSILESILLDIRSEESRLRSEENALIGLVHLRLYCINNRRTELKEAYRMLSRYAHYDSSGKYAKVLAQASELLESDSR